MSETLKIIIEILVGLIALGGLSALLMKISKLSAKVTPFLTKSVQGAEGMVPILRALGMDELADGVMEGADVPDAVNKLMLLIEEFTADGKITASEAFRMFSAGKTVFIEGKDFYVKILKKE